MSSVAPLPANEPPNFTVSWSGSNPGGPDISNYSVYVSDNGGLFAPFQLGTTATSATFNGQAGHTYAFYSVATDILAMYQRRLHFTAKATTTVTLTTPVITWTDPSDITYGTTLGTTQLDATATVSGTFTYTFADGSTAADGAVLDAGQDQILNVTFTPSDSADYTTATAQVKISVTPAALTVTGSGTQVYGGSPSFSASYSGFVLGQDSSVLGGATGLRYHNHQ